MKAGIVSGAFRAWQALHQAEIPFRKRLVFLWLLTRSPAANPRRKFFERNAPQHPSSVLSRPSPARLLKTARKVVR